MFSVSMLIPVLLVPPVAVLMKVSMSPLHASVSVDLVMYKCCVSAKPAETLASV